MRQLPSTQRQHVPVFSIGFVYQLAINRAEMTPIFWAHAENISQHPDPHPSPGAIVHFIYSQPSGVSLNINVASIGPSCLGLQKKENAFLYGQCGIKVFREANASLPSFANGIQTGDIESLETEKAILHT